jgi:hypothetical protein
VKVARFQGLAADIAVFKITQYIVLQQKNKRNILPP